MSRAMGAVGLVMAASLLSSCSNGGGESTKGSESPGKCDPASTELNLGVGTEMRGFDVVNGGSIGTAGGTERTAVFDTIMEYDPKTGEFVPKIAESFEPNADFTEWTLNLRDDVTFASGNPVTTDAVKFSVDRHGAEDTVSQNKAQMDVIESMNIISPQEMVFTLDAPQGDFPSAFAGAVGMLAEPAVFEEMGAEAFALDPGLGAAGPYKVDSYTQGEEIVLSRRDDYWGKADDKFCVGKITFTVIKSSESRRDALINRELDMGVVVYASILNDIREAGLNNEMSYSWGMDNLLINHGAGRPGKDLRVRQAVAHALDPETIDERANRGTGVPSSALVTKDSKLWSEGLDGPQFDPEMASTLLDAAKADGFDGKVTLSCFNDQTKIEWAIAVEAMLEKVGFEVNLDNSRDISDLIASIYLPGNYDLACMPVAMVDSSPWASFQAVVLGQDPVIQGRVGYESEAMATAMTELRVAATDEARQEALQSMQEVWNKEIPSAITGHTQQGTAWNDNVTGVRHSVSSNILFDDIRVSE